MIKIMYICTGNICRSAMADAMMKEEIKNRDLQNKIEVYSCGTFAEDGDYASYNAIETMEYYGVDLRLHRATNIRSSKIEEMDIILCATKEHKKFVSQLYPQIVSKVFTMKEYAKSGKDENDLDIQDPWGYGMTTFLNCAKEIDLTIQKTLEILLTNVEK